MVIGVPASSRRGPGTCPSSIICLTTKATSLREPRSRMVVVPASTAFRMLLVARMVSCWSFSDMASDCASCVALQCMWQWASTSPGSNETSPRSNTSYVPPSALAGTFADGSTAVMIPSSTTTA